MLKFLREQLAKLREQRAALTADLDGIIAIPTTEKRDLSADETRAFDAKRADISKLDEEIKAMEQRVADAEFDAERRAKVTPSASVSVGSEPRTYDSRRHSYFLDMARAQMGMGDGDGGPDAARQRLSRHAAELRVDMPSREARRSQQAEQDLGTIPGLSRRARENAFERGGAEQRVSPNRTDGQGGYFVPPLWLMDEFIDLPRFGRTTANLPRQLALPGGTDSINLPKVNTGTATGVQTGDGGTVVSQDLTDTFVNAPVRTIAGQQDIAIQLLDQSPVSFDQIVFADLVADYNQRLDVQVISGSGTGGQLAGILGTSGINAVTFTNGSPTLPLLWVPLLQSASKVAIGLKRAAASGVVMTPSMWYWALSQLDSSNRPLILSSATAAFNPAGVGGLLESDGPAGYLTYGLPAFLDGNIPSNLGAGTNETRIITARWEELFLWEGSMRTRVLSEVLSGTLQVRLQVYNYVAFMANRRPEAIAVISGTGVIPATGF